MSTCHIVVGGGTAGIILCHRLLEAGHDVHLIERGSDDGYNSSPSVKNPISWSVTSFHSGEGDRDLTSPQSALASRQIKYPQGAGIGGTANLNAMLWTGGHPAVFDDSWPEEWNSKRMERLLDSVKEIVAPLTMNSRGALKSLLLNDPASQSTKTEKEAVWDTLGRRSAYLATMNEKGKGIEEAVQDQTHPKANASYERTNIREILLEVQSKEAEAQDGTVGSLKRGKLTIISDCIVESIRFEPYHEPLRTSYEHKPKKGDTKGGNGGKGKGDKKQGDDFEQALKEMEEELKALPSLRAVAVVCKLKANGECRIIKPSEDGEIVLCAGAFQTPRILMASGLAGPECAPAAPAVPPAAVDEKSADAKQESDKDKDKDTDKNGKDKDGNGIAKKAKVRNDSSPKASYLEPSEVSVRLSGIGRNYTDHPTVPVFALGQWWNTGEKREFRMPISIFMPMMSLLMLSTTLPGLYYWGFLDPTPSEYFGKYKHPVAMIGILTGVYAVGFLSSALFQSLNRRTSLLTGIAYPPNGVHGWVNLDADGKVLPDGSAKPPSAQLLLLDSHRALQILVPELALPYLSLDDPANNKDATTWDWFAYYRNGLYMFYVRPALESLILALLKVPIFQLLEGLVYGFLVCCVKPQSRGVITPTTADPKFLSAESDRIIMRNAVTTARAMLRGKSVEIAEGKTTKGSATTGFRVPWSLEVLPGPLFLYANMDATFNAYSSMTANTYYHACGTCPMEVKRKKGSKSSAASAAAPAADAVVDAQLRVKGVRGLRIADASVFPAIPSGPIAATVMAVGYGAAELILAANPNSASASGAGAGAKR